MLALLLVAGSLGLNNFAGAIAIGLSGVDGRLRLKVALAFGIFEVGMPLVGLLIGRQIASVIGSSAHIPAGGLLVVVGLYVLVAALRGDRDAAHVADQGFGRLLISALALSIDNLIVGFALGAYRVSLALAIAVIGAVSVTLSLIGLEIGRRLGRRFERQSEILAGALLIAVGAAIAAGLI